ncbi:HK97-gp10 family putative phage morphogenesis protein [Virgibacillus oceani]
MKLDVSGFDELTTQFSRMASDELTKLENEAVKDGAEIVKKQQEQNWNRSGSDGEHIKDNINVGRPSKIAEGTGINVGPKMSLRWRGKFVEYGTSYQAPQRPVERSGAQSERAATSAMMRVLERVVS